MALDTDMEGETTALYIYRQLTPAGIKISTIARGIAFGDDLEYADEFTLGKAIVNRQLFSLYCPIWRYFCWPLGSAPTPWR